MKRLLGDIREAVEDFAGGMGNRRINTFAAAGAYYLFMSLVPMIMLLVSVIQFTPLTQDVVMAQVAEYIPDSMYQLVARIVDGVYSGGGVALTVSAVLTVWSASAGMKALMRGMDSVYDARRRENYVTFSLRACLYMLVLIAVLLVSLSVMVYGGRILNLIQSYMPVSAWGDFLFTVLKYLRFLVVLALLALVFTLVYRWMPAEREPFRHQLAGAVFAAVTWVLFSSIFSVYVSLSDKFGAYGFIGTIMVAMMWMYYCLYFLLLGGYINRYLDLRRERGGD